jgi:uncharacterized Ntn-hydrolase superfamily protein
MTWSILARDPATGEIGAAVATRFFAVGALCPGVEGGVGAVCTQALVRIVAALAAADAGRAHRQLHVMSADGRIAAHAGAECVDWCGHAAGTDVSVAGNMLAGPQVVAATRDTFLASAGAPLAERLLMALEAGEAAGGDKRGRQSAALMIASRDPYPDLDIRADDHPDPLAELRRLLAVARERYLHFRPFLPGRDHPGTFDRAVIEAGIARATAS